MKKTKKYRCRYCGERYYEKEEAKECESKGWPEFLLGFFLVHEGDIKKQYFILLRCRKWLEKKTHSVIYITDALCSYNNDNIGRLYSQGLMNLVINNDEGKGWGKLRKVSQSELEEIFNRNEKFKRKYENVFKYWRTKLSTQES